MLSLLPGCNTFRLLDLDSNFTFTMSNTDSGSSWQYSSSDDDYESVNPDFRRDQYNTRSSATTSFNLGLSQLLDCAKSEEFCINLLRNINDIAQSIFNFIYPKLNTQSKFIVCSEKINFIRSATVYIILTPLPRAVQQLNSSGQRPSCLTGVMPRALRARCITLLKHAGACLSYALSRRAAG